MERHDTDASSKKGFDKTIIVGIILVILLIVLAVSITYVVEGIIEFLRDVGTESFSAHARFLELPVKAYKKT